MDPNIARPGPSSGLRRHCCPAAPPQLALPSAGSLLPALVLAAALLLAAPAAGQTLSSYQPIDGSFTNTGGSWRLAKDRQATLFLVGEDLTDGASVIFTEDPANCDNRFGSTTIRGSRAGNTEAFADVEIPVQSDAIYFCMGAAGDTHQGVVPQRTLSTYTIVVSEDLIPLGASIVIIIVLLFMSGLFSGLNLGLMSLDPSELKIVADTGSKKEAKYASAILPLRRRGNLLLCTVLLGNVLVNSTLTILLDGLTGGLGAILGSTAGIVVFGEILPQSICSRHALAVGAHTIWLTKFFMFVTFPVAWPISAILDKVLGDEVGAVYMRKSLLHLLRMQDPYNDLERDEVNIITGALTYKEKTARMVMTPIADVFMLEISAILDFRTVTRIMESGHSRIPTYDGERENIVGVLYVKDLAFIDPDDKTPLESVIKYYKHRIEEVDCTTKLDSMLDLFKLGRTHMVMVVEIDTDVDTDPVRSVVGIATLEDVIEEIIQAEIIDETDRIVDNVSKAQVKRDGGQLMLPSAFSQQLDEPSRLSEQMALAVFTYLTTVVEPFSSQHILPNVLRKLIAQPACLREFNFADDVEDSKERNPERTLYTAGTTTGVFTLVLEGRVKVRVGKDNFTFEAGPFNTIAVSALTVPHFECDFSAEITSESALLLQIPQKFYRDALTASRLALREGYRMSPRLAGMPRGLTGAESALQDNSSETAIDMEGDTDREDGSGSDGDAGEGGAANSGGGGGHTSPLAVVQSAPEGAAAPAAVGGGGLERRSSTTPLLPTQRDSEV